MTRIYSAYFKTRAVDETELECGRKRKTLVAVLSDHTGPSGDCGLIFLWRVPSGETIWYNIKPQLIQHLDQMKAHRIVYKRQRIVRSLRQVAIDILRNYKNALLLFTVAPSAADFLALDCVRQVVYQSSKITVDETSFDSIVKHLPEIFATFQVSVERRVIELTFRPGSLSDEKVSQFKPACNTFYFKRCTIFARQNNKRKKKDHPEWVTPLFYPDNMLHRRLHLGLHVTSKPKDSLLAIEGARVRQARSTDELAVVEDFCEVIRDMVLLVGKDSRETTAQDMDSALEDIQLKCDKYPPELSEDAFAPCT
ncbi:hypothetical protein DFS33DRAFT_1439140 [Desarmillaria ectypa]|nr:hypothetical protein DFS33DRAFT_1439140 [Desarmillaria ectypa]